MSRYHGYRLNHILPGDDKLIEFDSKDEATRALRSIRNNIYSTRKNYRDRKYRASLEGTTVRIQCEYVAHHGRPEALKVGEYLDYETSQIDGMGDRYHEVRMSNGKYRLMRVW